MGNTALQYEIEGDLVLFWRIDLAGFTAKIAEEPKPGNQTRMP
jgi:hypothetical protein